MKCAGIVALLVIGQVSALDEGIVSQALDSLKGDKQFPGGPAGAVKVVTQLMREWSIRIETEGKAELASYDKYACWCEDTLARKAKDIADAKELIDELQKRIEKLMGELASHEAEIKHLKKLIAQNKQEQQDATDARNNENAEFEASKTENEQCVGALEAAIRVLSGAGEGGKKGFLQTMEEAQVLSIVGGVQRVLTKVSPSKRVSHQDLDFAKEFFSQPQKIYSHPHRDESSLLAVDHNPFGDYAPQSTRIVGVLKGLYDTFTLDLEKENVEEADAQKAYEEFIATKKAELVTLELTLDQQEAAAALKKKDMAESRALRAETQEKLKADEAFFAVTKEGCQEKAIEWGMRVRLRTQELQGIAKAIEILSDPESQEVFANSSAVALVQLSSQVDKPRLSVLQTIARSTGSSVLKKILEKAKAGGYFDKVIWSIEEMISLLRAEEKRDIEHRDRCQNSLQDDKITKEDLQTDIDKAGDDANRLSHEQGLMGSDLTELDNEILKTENDMAQSLAMRDLERRQFEKSVKDDTAAIALIERALDALVAFYKRNKIPMLVQKQPDREYTIDPDKAPETVWDAEGAAYTGKKSENEGIVAILKMIIEDVQKEIDDSRKDDAEAQAEYEKERKAMEESHLAQLQAKADMERRIQELDASIQDLHDLQAAKQGDLQAQNKLSSAIYTDCSWVETHFTSRAAARKKELDGLVSAKAYLAGVASGTELAP